MGLAASQARLLFITSRQSDVSANMQRISQENIILARDEEDVSTKYNQMLSATKMEYVDGVDLSYNALMGAGGAESGATSVKPITNSSGQLVMSSSALSAYGLPARGGAGDITSYYSNAKSFVEKVAGSEVASEVDGINSTANVAESTDNNDTAEGLSFTDIAKLMGTVGRDTVIGKNRDCGITKDEAESLSWEEVLTTQEDSKIQFLLSAFKSGRDDDSARAQLKKLLNSMGSAILNGLKNYNITSSQVTKAVENTYNQFSEVTRIVRCDREKNASLGDDIHTTTTQHNILMGQAVKGSDTCQHAVNGQELLKTLLCNLWNEVNQPEEKDKYKGATNVNMDSYKLNLQDKNNKTSSTTKNTTASVTNKSRAQYYMSLYESLKNGWISDSEDSINSKLQSGEYNISSEYKKEVADTETRNKAEAYYKTELAKINRKEKILDNQLTKLQTEYSALTNDYNSVKSILDANIQKSFTYCQNG